MLQENGFETTEVRCFVFVFCLLWYMLWYNVPHVRSTALIFLSRNRSISFFLFFLFFFSFFSLLSLSFLLVTFLLLSTSSLQITIASQSITASVGAAVTQTNGFNVWTVTLTSGIAMTAVKDATVTQANGVTGTLVSALDGTTTTTFQVRSLVAVTFAASANVNVVVASGGSSNGGLLETIVTNNLASIVQAETRPDAAGTLLHELTGNTTLVVVKSEHGTSSTFDATTELNIVGAANPVTSGNVASVLLLQAAPNTIVWRATVTTPLTFDAPKATTLTQATGRVGALHSALAGTTTPASVFDIVTPIGITLDAVTQIVINVGSGGTTPVAASNLTPAERTPTPRELWP